MLTVAEVTSAYDQLEFKRDRRRPPDEQRRSRFRSGWRDADRRADGYSRSTLAKLTWQNLGYRLGERFGPRNDSDVDFAFDILAEHYVIPTAQAAPSPAQYAAAFRRVRTDLGDFSATTPDEPVETMLFDLAPVFRLENFELGVFREFVGGSS